MAPQPDYVFTRDYVDNNRINLQHYQWVELFGYHLHPEIPKVDANARIADVGMGTAVWLTDLSSRLPPTVQLDGLDISFDAAPPAAWLPSNVKFRHWDVRTPVPADLVETYDIVHLRFFLFVLRNEEISDVLQNVVKLIKPGGYLQWSDHDMSSFRIEKTDPGNKVEALTNLLKLSQPQDSRLSPTWVPLLPELFAKAGGLRDIRSDVKDPPGHMAMFMHECNLSLHEILARKAGNKELDKKVKELLPAVESETRQGACWAFTRWTVIGRK